MKKKVLLTLSIPLFLYMIAVGYLLITSTPKPVKKSYYAVVLGNKVEANGRPSKRLTARLDKVYELYHAGTVARIIVSGGVDPAGTNEAVAMKEYLRKKGVRYSHLIVDSLGNNTHLTAKNAKAILKPSDPIVVVSERYHTPRTKLAFRHAGFTNVQSASPRFFEARTLYSWLREVPAFVKYKVKKL